MSLNEMFLCRSKIKVKRTQTYFAQMMRKNMHILIFIERFEVTQSVALHAWTNTLQYIHSNNLKQIF